MYRNKQSYVLSVRENNRFSVFIHTYTKKKIFPDHGHQRLNVYYSLWKSVCPCSRYGQPNERKGRINILDSDLWFTAPFHGLHALQPHHSIHLSSLAFKTWPLCTQPTPQADYFPPFPLMCEPILYFNYLLCHSLFPWTSLSVFHVCRIIITYKSRLRGPLCETGNDDEETPPVSLLG